MSCEINLVDYYEFFGREEKGEERMDGIGLDRLKFIFVKRIYYFVKFRV